MGNCINAMDPVFGSIPTGINVDGTLIKESGLPIIFLIGGPGVGKKTLTSRVAERYGFVGLISADLIRQEVSMRTERAFTLARMMSQGQLVPTNIVVELIAVKMLEHLRENKGFLVIGFPQQKEQCRIFDRAIRQPDLVLFLQARNSVLSDRIMARTITTRARMSMNFDSIRKQIKDFHKRNRSVMRYYKHLLVVIDGEPDVTTVYEKVCEVIDNMLLNFSTSSNVQSNVATPVNNKK
nr:PREDICTED: adenylate kinase isoenzyme 1-like [Megachile rotundata]